jgi:ParB family chromosome partitioning protein
MPISQAVSIPSRPIAELRPNPFNPRGDVDDAWIKQMPISQAVSIPSRPIAELRPNPFNPRGDVDDAGLEELAESIRAQGVLQPLLVTPGGVVVAGHRRLAAARMAGLVEVPVVIRDLDRIQQQEIMLVENLQRQDLSPVEEARAYRQLLDAGHTTAQLARRIGAPAARINARLVLLNWTSRSSGCSTAAICR